MRDAAPLATLLVFLLPTPLDPSGGGRERSPERADPASSWDARSAEHLLNRAGFGATPEEVAELVALGREASVERLLTAEPVDRFEASDSRRTIRGHVRAIRPRRETPRVPLEEVPIRAPDFYESVWEYLDWWIGSMLDGRDPLRDRMTLFWHGHFTSGFADVENDEWMVEQLDFLRENAFGSFDVLVRGIARDPAMLEYLDNNVNVRGHPNENWARELLELFTLGDGNYTEHDIREASRAFTGWTEREGEFRVAHEQHDFGPKRFLGRLGNFGGDEVIDVVLEREACGRWLAGKLLAFFEGVEPTEERLAAYGGHLRAHDYDLTAFLRRLLNDPEFYRDEVVGRRVAGPIHYFVASARRIGAPTSPELVYASAALLGQKIFQPPNVKGWEEGLAWITGDTLIQRSNCMQVALGLSEVPDSPWFGEMRSEGSPRAPRPLLAIRNDPALIELVQQVGWSPHVSLVSILRAAGAAGDAEQAETLLDRLLGIEADEATIAAARALVAQARNELGVEEGELLDAEGAEHELRRVAHVLLSLPEAQLH